MFAENYFSKKIYHARARKILPYDMGILVNNLEENPPSNKRFFKRLDKAAEKFGFNIEMIDKDDYHRIAEFDALFIRETTSVNHHTFRMAQRAHVEGLVVIDDPSSILKCTNKVYLAELMEHNHIPAPETIILSRENMNCAPDSLGFPIILKKPDSSFSQGVVKVESRDEYMQQANQLLEKSDLIIAQKFVPTDFDWRIGILDRQPLYACKYWMAKAHWQIMDWKKKGNARFGNVETVPIEQVPPRVVKLALRAANLIGDGLYGVDIKCSNNNYYIIEVNDNPTIEGGEEDQVLKDELYVRLMDVFLRRVQIKKDGSWKI
jgi:glutathione synthase/RimK-type ligase-like ATP-grasp enzyme